MAGMPQLPLVGEIQVALVAKVVGVMAAQRMAAMVA